MTLEIIGAIVRWLLSLAAGGLVVRHVITASQADALATSLTSYVLLAIPVVVPILWSIGRIAARYARAELLKADSYIGR